jgi:hypothetical protein
MILALVAAVSSTRSVTCCRSDGWRRAGERADRRKGRALGGDAGFSVDARLTPGWQCMHCQQPGKIRDAGLRKAIHRFSRNRSMFSLSLHEASLQRLSRPVTLHGTAPCRDQVAFPFSTRAMQGTRSTDFGRVATRGRVYPLPINNIVVGLPHPAVLGDCRTSDANRSYARSLKPTGGHARPTDRSCGNARTSRASGRSLQRLGAKSREKPWPALPSCWATRVMLRGHRPPGPVEGLLPVSRDSDSACGAHSAGQLRTPLWECQELFGGGQSAARP